MSDGPSNINISDTLAFRPKWVWDPAPWWVFQYLEKDAVTKLAVVELEHRKAMLEADLMANKQALEIVQKRIR